jgi:hypothetical protein
VTDAPSAGPDGDVNFRAVRHTFEDLAPADRRTAWVAYAVPAVAALVAAVVLEYHASWLRTGPSQG